MIRVKFSEETEELKVKFSDVVEVPEGSGENPGGVRVVWHQCPEPVRKFLETVSYDPGDYTSSRIAEFAPATAVEENTKPVGRAAGGLTFGNEVPLRETAFSGLREAGSVKPLDQLRWIGTTDIANFRDLGGWTCDGGTVAYGRIFRGSRLINSQDREFLLQRLHLGAELDLRFAGEIQEYPDTLEEYVEYLHTDGNWYSISNREKWRAQVGFVFDSVAKNRNIWIHCAGGLDRTGTLVCVLEGILGMSQSDIDKDYELGCFYAGCGTEMQARRRNESEWKGLMEAIGALKGNTFRDKCVNFVVSLGFTAREINGFRKAMIQGSPELLQPAVETFPVTKTVDHASITGQSTATQFRKYQATIIPEEGYVLGDVQVTMDGRDITAEVFQGEETLLRHAVRKNLINCKIMDNLKSTVIHGEGYAATVTAQEGYSMENGTVTIFMGGMDMSAYYANGVIAIPNVTGSIVITATAVASSAAYTNLADPTDSLWQTDFRLNSSGVATAQSGKTVCNAIACGKGDTIYFKGVTSFEVAGGDRIALYLASGVGDAISYTAALLENGEDNITGYLRKISEGYYAFHCNYAGSVSLRAAFTTPENTGDIIITRNEPIA